MRSPTWFEKQRWDWKCKIKNWWDYIIVGMGCRILFLNASGVKGKGPDLSHSLEANKTNNRGMYLWDWTLIGVGSISVYYICMQHSQARAWTTMLRIKTKYGYKTTMRFAWSAWYCFVTLPLSVLPHHDHSKNSKEICRSIHRTKIQRRNKLGYGRSRGCRRNSTVALLILGPDVAGELVRSKEHFMVRRMWILSDWMMHCPLFTLQDREHASQLGYLLVKCIYGRNFLMFQFWKLLVDGCNMS